MKRAVVLALAGIFLLALNSCILDPKEGKTPPKPTQPYKDLSGERDNVLFNLEKSYNERNIDQYNKLLDNDFVFHFSNVDVQQGNVNVTQWDRAAEINANKNMFDPNFNKPGVEPVSSIDLSLTYVAGDNNWTQVTPPDPVKYPGETWYEKIVNYTLTVKAGSNEYQGLNIQASFVVRWATVEGQSYWRIVSWHDDTGTH